MMSKKEIREHIDRLKVSGHPCATFAAGELKWVLIDEPRYSVEELKKIAAMDGIFEGSNSSERCRFELLDFIEKNPNHVRDILQAKS